MEANAMRGGGGGGEPVSELWDRAVDAPCTSSRTSSVQQEESELQEASAAPSVQTCCTLSRCDLQHLPHTVFNNGSLKHLYLEGNHLTSVPGSMFISLPHLLWLDIRNNQIASLPAEIGSHRCLKTLLLEGNPISELPPELGNVISLKGLNLRNCPIRFPPLDVLHQGHLVILQYLRSVLAQRPVSVAKSPPEMPVMEKLHLSDLGESGMEEQNEPEDENELQRFQELKEKLILLDRAELGPARPSRRRTLPSVDRRRPPNKEEKEKQAALEQIKKSKEALQKWQAQAKLIRERKTSELKQKKRKKQRKREEGDSESGLEFGSSSHPTLSTSMEDSEVDRSARELELEIQELVERMKGNRWNPLGTATEQKAAVEEQEKEIKTLQNRVRVRKRNVERDLGNIFTIYTANTWPSFLDK